MNRYFITFSYLMILYCISIAQAPDTQWSRIYLEENYEYATSVKETKGGYVICGYNYNNPAYYDDIYLMKIGYGGNIRWTRLYGIAGFDVANYIYVTGDSGFIMTGESDSYGFFLLRTDIEGNMLWMRSYPGTIGWSVKETSDGGFIAAGENDDKFFIVRTNSNGDCLWCRTFGQEYFYSKAYSVCETSDGCFVVTGYMREQPLSDTDLWLLKLNPWGDTLWVRTHGGTNRDGGDCVEETADGGLIIAGRTVSFGLHSWDVFLVKTDRNGNLEWYNTFGGGEWDGAHSVQQTESGGYFIGAYSWSFGTYVDYYFIETDPSGNELWSKVAGEYSKSEWSHSSILTSDGGYIMVGNRWQSNENKDDIYVVKLAPTSTPIADDMDKEDTPPTSFSRCYPNPFNTATTIKFVLPKPQNVKITIYNLLGRRVQTLVDEYKQAGSQIVTYDASHLSSGVYFYRLWTGDVVESKRMVLLK